MMSPWSRGGLIGVRFRSRRNQALIGVVAVAGVLLLLLPTVLLGWAPVLHWTCVYQDRVAEGVTFVPAVLVNSPFGGNATGRGTIPPYFPGSLGYPTLGSFQTSFAENGTASGTFNSVNVSVFKGRSELALGPGLNSPCSQSFSVVPTQPPFLGTYAGWQLGLASNLTDKGEGSSVSFSSFGGYRVLPLYFNNSFSVASGANISTCNAPSRSVALTANSDSLSVSIGFSLDGRNETAPMTLPFVQSYLYWFPANFGTWQVDNLSAPGGPGGGWAFNYLGPCA